MPDELPKDMPPTPPTQGEMSPNTSQHPNGQPEPKAGE